MAPVRSNRALAVLCAGTLSILSMSGDSTIVPCNPVEALSLQLLRKRKRIQKLRMVDTEKSGEDTTLIGPDDLGEEQPEESWKDRIMKTICCCFRSETEEERQKRQEEIALEKLDREDRMYSVESAIVVCFNRSIIKENWGFSTP